MYLPGHEADRSILGKAIVLPCDLVADRPGATKEDERIMLFWNVVVVCGAAVIFR